MAKKPTKIFSAVLACALTAGVLPVYVADASGEQYISVPQSMRAYANEDRTYTVGGTDSLHNKTGQKNSNGKSGKKHWTINAASFVANDAWVYDWGELRTETTDSGISYKTNELETGGIRYAFDIPYSGEEPDETAEGFYTCYNIKSADAGSEAAGYVNTLDVEDGYYTGISFIGAMNKANTYIRFVYEDGTKSDWTLVNTDKKQLTDSAGSALTLAANSWIRIASGEDTDKTDSDSIYLHVFTVMGTDPAKKLTEIEFPTKNSKISDVTKDPVGVSSSTNFETKILGVTLLTTAEARNDVYVSEFKSIWADKPADFSGSDADMTWLVSLEEAYEKIDQSLVTKTEDKEVIAAADEFLASIENQLNDKYIDELSQIMSALPEKDLLEISDDNAEIIEKMKKQYKKIKPGLAMSDERKAVLTKYNEYTAAYEALLVAENSRKVAEIKELVGTLPPISEFDKVETFTKEVVAALRDIEAILKTVDETIEIEDKATYNAAKQYAAHVNTVYRLENAQNIAEIDALLSLLPTVGKVDKTIENERTINKIKKYYLLLNTDYLTEQEKNTADTAEAYIALLGKFPPVSVTISPETFANMDTAYRSGGSGFADSSDTLNYFIDGASFMKMDIWQEPWQVAEHEADNTLVFNGIAYKIKVADGDNAIMAAFTPGADTTVGYTEVDVEDGCYRGVSFLGATNKNGTKAGVRFNYKDGGSSKWQSVSMGRFHVESDTALKIPAGTYSAADGTIYGQSGYLYQYTFNNPEPEREVVSISIPYRNVTINSDGTMTINPTSGGTAYAYWGRWLGITMLQNAGLFEDRISQSFTSLSGVAENKLRDAVDEVDKLVVNAEVNGMDVSQIDGYKTYEASVSQFVKIRKYVETSTLKTATVKVVFAAEVNAEADNVKLKNGDGDDVEFDFSCKGKEITVTFANDLDTKKEYTLTLSGNITAKNGGGYLGDNVDYKFNIPDCAGFESFEITPEGENARVSFVFENKQLQQTDALIVVLVLDEAGAIYDSFAAKKEKLAVGDKLTVTGKEIQLCGNYTVKVLCWDNLNGLNTICKY